jgi:hypothetical protein
MGESDLLGKQVELELQIKLARAERSLKKEIVFPREELEQIRQVNLWLQQILSELKNKQTENPQKYKNENYEKRVLELIMSDLDKLDLWLCKFSTSNRAHQWDNLSPKETDSIYYMTPSGASIRFKRIMFDENNSYAKHPDEHGLHYVVQDFATFIYFKNRHGGSNVPTVKDSEVKEIFDDKFQAMINQENPIQTNYSTGFATLTDKDGLWSATTVGTQNRDDVRTHEGSLVNKIFFNRFKNN